LSSIHYLTPLKSVALFHPSLNHVVVVFRVRGTTQVLGRSAVVRTRLAGDVHPLSQAIDGD
ncbi:hypothetical protein RA263_28520, partial [Pseudomonas syringae pv. tagetis]|uniref:hypothetical protein n=1 Tax=Pseudomonas syringae group genomosp. 7 TaxID=251699 RepID=UPI0037700406